MKKIARRSVFGLLFVTGVVLLTWKLTPREQTLLDQAQKIITLSHDDRQYCWLSDHELVTENHPDDTTAHLTFRDLRTGQKTVPTLLTKHFVEAPNEGILPSPDGQWMLIVPFDGSPNLRFLHRTGQEIVVENGNTRLGWLADGQHWIEIIENSNPNPNPSTNGEDTILSASALIHPLHTPMQTHSLPFNPPLTSEDVSLLGIRNDKLLLRDCSQYDMENFHNILVYQLGASELKQIGTYPAPPHTDNFECKLSPDGTRLTWHLTETQVSPLQSWLHRLFPATKATPQVRSILWVSNLDGSGKHQIGYLKRMTNATDENDLSGLQWLPDGKRLSFEVNDILYTVPAD